MFKGQTRNLIYMAAPFPTIKLYHKKKANATHFFCISQKCFFVKIQPTYCGKPPANGEHILAKLLPIFDWKERNKPSPVPTPPYPPLYKPRN